MAQDHHFKGGEVSLDNLKVDGEKFICTIRYNGR